MKIFIGGEIENDIYEQFRIARNLVLSELEKISLEIEDVLEISLYIFLLKGFETVPRKRYAKKQKRLEIEVVLLHDEFKISDEQQHTNIIKQSIINSISNYNNKNIAQTSIDLIKSEFAQKCKVNNEMNLE
jgi:hypothetical protein